MPGLPTEPAPDIVKLGGSLTRSPRLPALLARLAAGGAPRVLVPGGGELADAVRALQPRLRLSEQAAHRMAILAMEQTAIALADIEPALVPAATPLAIADAHKGGRAALWLPAAMALAARDLPASWDVTSDSLALWLAITLGAARLTLVKSVPARGTGPRAWAAEGLVDAHFPAMARGFTGIIETVPLDDVLDAGSRAA